MPLGHNSINNKKITNNKIDQQKEKEKEREKLNKAGSSQPALRVIQVLQVSEHYIWPKGYKPP